MASKLPRRGGRSGRVWVCRRACVASKLPRRGGRSGRGGCAGERAWCPGAAFCTSARAASAPHAQVGPLPKLAHFSHPSEELASPAPPPRRSPPPRHPPPVQWARGRDRATACRARVTGPGADAERTMRGVGGRAWRGAEGPTAAFSKTLSGPPRCGAGGRAWLGAEGPTGLIEDTLNGPLRCGAGGRAWLGARGRQQPSRRR